MVMFRYILILRLKAEWLAFGTYRIDDPRQLIATGDDRRPIRKAIALLFDDKVPNWIPLGFAF